IRGRLIADRAQGGGVRLVRMGRLGRRAYGGIVGMRGRLGQQLFGRVELRLQIAVRLIRLGADAVEHRGERLGVFQRLGFVRVQRRVRLGQRLARVRLFAKRLLQRLSRVEVL